MNIINDKISNVCGLYLSVLNLENDTEKINEAMESQDVIINTHLSQLCTQKETHSLRNNVEHVYKHIDDYSGRTLLLLACLKGLLHDYDNIGANDTMEQDHTYNKSCYDLMAISESMPVEVIDEVLYILLFRFRLLQKDKPLLKQRDIIWFFESLINKVCNTQGVFSSVKYVFNYKSLIVEEVASKITEFIRQFQLLTHSLIKHKNAIYSSIVLIPVIILLVQAVHKCSKLEWKKVLAFFSYLIPANQLLELLFLRKGLAEYYYTLLVANKLFSHYFALKCCHDCTVKGVTNAFIDTLKIMEEALNDKEFTRKDLRLMIIEILRIICELNISIDDFTHCLQIKWKSEQQGVVNEEILYAIVMDQNLRGTQLHSAFSKLLMIDSKQ